MCCPAPYKDSVHTDMQKLADDLARHLEPNTKAYYEIWLRDDASGEETLLNHLKRIIPIYGKTYLPRKFKTAIALPEDNCVDVYTMTWGTSQ